MSNDSVSVLVSNSQVTRQPPLVAAANVRVEIPNDAESQMDNEEIPVLAQTWYCLSRVIPVFVNQLAHLELQNWILVLMLFSYPSFSRQN